MDDGREMRFRRRKKGDFDEREGVMRMGAGDVADPLYIYTRGVLHRMGGVSRIQPSDKIVK
jgi:hypothetical protein